MIICVVIYGKAPKPFVLQICIQNIWKGFKSSRKGFSKAFEKKSEKKGFSLFIIMQVCDFWQKDDDFNIF